MISRSPSQRDVYEARRKAIRDYASAIEDARHEGIERGIEKGHRVGKVEQVRMLQGLLSEPLMAESQLMVLDLSQLTSLVDELQSRLMQRRR